MNKRKVLVKTMTKSQINSRYYNNKKRARLMQPAVRENTHIEKSTSSSEDYNPPNVELANIPEDESTFSSEHYNPPNVELANTTEDESTSESVNDNSDPESDCDAEFNRSRPILERINNFSDRFFNISKRITVKAQLVRFGL